MGATHPIHRALPDEEIKELISLIEQYGGTYKAARQTGISRSKFFRAKCIHEGKCQQCGKNPLMDNYRTCEPCRIKSGQRSKERREQRMASSCCSECGNPLDGKSPTFCNSCAEHARNKQVKLRQRRRDNGICYSCSKPAIEGRGYCNEHIEYMKVASVKSRSNSQFGGLYESVLERDGHVCQICGHTNAFGDKPRLEVHHIHGRKNTMDNLITLCAYCHKAITFLNYSKHPDLVYDWFVKTYQH